LESEPSSPGYVSPTLQIDPARFFRRRDDWTEAEVAADALGRIGAAAAAEAIAMLDDPSPTVRRRGAEILAHIGADAEEAIEPLIRTLEQDPDPQVRKAAAYALGQMGPQAAAAVPALTNMLRKPGR
jgi:HEAT repeat protein